MPRNLITQFPWTSNINVGSKCGFDIHLVLIKHKHVLILPSIRSVRRAPVGEGRRRGRSAIVRENTGPADRRASLPLTPSAGTPRQPGHAHCSAPSPFPLSPRANCSGQQRETNFRDCAGLFPLHPNNPPVFCPLATVILRG